MPITSDLKFFARHEFQRPDLVDDTCARALDQVRFYYGAPLEITSDARSVEEEAALPNSATPPESSLHVQGRAFDLRWTFDDPGALYAVCGAIYKACALFGLQAEIEPRSPRSGQAPHLHIGWYPVGRPGKFELP